MTTIYGKSKIGKNVYLAENVIIGHPGKDEKDLLINKKFDKVAGAIIGDNVVVPGFHEILSFFGESINTKTSEKDKRYYRLIF